LIGIVIVAHGGLAREFRASAEHVVGPQKAVRTIAIEAECNRSMKQDEICEAANEVDQGDGVVVVTDMFGGSPSNLCMRACGSSERRIVYGANLPMLIKLMKTRDLTLDSSVEHALNAGRKYIDARTLS
jgi:PTS system mannose-specific IIA component